MFAEADNGCALSAASLIYVCSYLIDIMVI